MFLGEYTPTLDDKGRFTLPARMREQLEAGAYLTGEVERSLALWPPAEFERRAQQIQDQASHDAAGHDRAKFFFALSQDVTPDKQGRIAIPQSLRDFAGLGEGPVSVTGSFDHVEIRTVAAWQDKKSRGEEALARQQFTGAG